MCQLAVKLIYLWYLIYIFVDPGLWTPFVYNNQTNYIFSYADNYTPSNNFGEFSRGYKNP